MLYMNTWEIAESKDRHKSHPVLSRAANFLARFEEEVNAHSDGWAYWSAPVKAARKLQELVSTRGESPVTEAQLTSAISPIRSFYTRIGYAVGMTFPGSELRKD
jgi:hypothetical protein